MPVLTQVINALQTNSATYNLVSGLSQALPIAGPIIASFWRDHRDSKNQKNILKVLESMKTMNQDQLDHFQKELKNNGDEILLNQYYLEKLIVDVGQISDIVTQTGEKVESALKEMQEMRAMMAKFTARASNVGVENVVVPEKHVTISKEDFALFQQQTQEIERLKNEIKLKNQKPPVDLKYLIKDANLFYYSGQIEKAIVLYDTILKYDPKFTAALNNKGNVLSGFTKFEEAIAYYDKALEIEPKHTSALNGKGLSLSNLGKFEEAIACYDKALEIEPENIYALNHKGRVLHILEKFEEAIAYYDKALEIEPKFAYALFGKGNALSNLGKSEKAITYYDKALEITPNNSAAAYNKARELSLSDKQEEAIECLRKSIQLDPKYKEIAKNEMDFNNIKNEKPFQEILSD